MLRITIPGDEYFNEETQEFTTTNDETFDLEHSLLSLSKWEEEYEKPFLSDSKKTTDELVYYMKCMVITPNADLKAFDRIDQKLILEINDYISKNRSATTFRELPGSKSRREIVTSELIYYWMSVFSIPFECDKWNLNRLLALVKICNIKNSKQKKMPSSQIARQNRELNAKRLAQYKTNG